jgi:hypothetical protein
MLSFQPTHGKPGSAELIILGRLSVRLNGELHRVGYPREKLKRREEFNKYLKDKLGFGANVALGARRTEDLISFGKFH